MLALLPLLSTVALAAPCPGPVTPDAVTASVEAAEAAYIALDIDAFAGGMDALSMDLSCMSGALPAATAGRLHRLQAIRSYADGQQDRSMAAWRAARALGLDPLLPETLAPTGHPLHDLADNAIPDGELADQPQPAEGVMRWDGREGLGRPKTRAAVLQMGSETLSGHYLWPEDPMPPYRSVDVVVAEPAVVEVESVPIEDEPGPVEPEPLPLEPLPARSGGVPAFGLAGAAVTVAGVTTALVAHSRWQSANHWLTVEEQAPFANANRLGWGVAGAGALVTGIGFATRLGGDR